MGTRDQRVDAYISKSADFAKPILNNLRESVHEYCPEVEETMKWSFPHFMYRGMLCSMASFKQHCAFGFWKGSLVVDAKGRTLEQAMGQFGRIGQLSDLPTRTALRGFIRKAMQLNEAGVSARERRPKAGPRKALRAPPYFTAALRKNKAALATYEALPPSKKREYVGWLTEAKTDATREKRLASSLEWLAAGKARYWKYEKC
jgi:uncharacterized protein YdeI (YjbR/CyaY-like superfamily)